MDLCQKPYGSLLFDAESTTKAVKLAKDGSMAFLDAFAIAPFHISIPINFIDVGIASNNLKN